MSLMKKKLIRCKLAQKEGKKVAKVKEQSTSLRILRKVQTKNKI